MWVLCRALHLRESTDQPLQRPILYRDLAVSYFNVTSLKIRTSWNNGAFDGFDAPFPSAHYEHDPHESPDSCAGACDSHPDCFSWTHRPEKCIFVRSIRVGKPVEAKDAKTGLDNVPTVAGWPIRRIQDWVDHNQCDEVQWVRPSIERIF